MTAIARRSFFLAVLLLALPLTLSGCDPIVCVNPIGPGGLCVPS